MKQFHKTKEARRLRELHQAEMKRRKLAAKIGRDVRGWWTKIEKLISYKQKILADEERQAAMNKQLVVLVQQTEKYTESLTQNAITEEDDDDDDSDPSNGTETGESELAETPDEMITSDSDAITSGSEDGQRRRRRTRRRRRITIEEALAAEPNTRKSKKRVIDYSRMRLPSNEYFYGESTASDASGSDGSYSPDEDHSNDNSDDDSTFQQAMHDELKERNQDETSTFLADPEELRKLREEVSMDLDEVLERLRSEAEEGGRGTLMEIESSRPGTPTIENKSDSKRVHFSETMEENELAPQKGEGNSLEIHVSSHYTRSSATPEHVVKYDADDDGDASDVEDYDDVANQRSDEEIEVADLEVDAETTIAQDESLSLQLSAADELTLLQKEGQMSIDDLRSMYANRDQGTLETSTTLSNEEEEAFEDCEEFEPPAVAEVDDETTMEAEEKLGRDMTYEEEMALLKQDNDIPIEQLRSMYSKAAALESDEANEDDDMDGDDESNELAPLHQTSATHALAGVLQDEDIGSDADGGEEFEFNESEAVDDETTIDLEERLGQDISYEDEIALLKRESEMSVEELRAKYAGIGSYATEEGGGNSDESENQAEDHAIKNAKSSSLTSEFFAQDEENHDEEEFAPNEGDAMDDETTIEAEERLGREMSYEEEIDVLKREGEMSVEELRKLYAGMVEDDDDSDRQNEETEESDAEEPPRKSSKRKRSSCDNNGGSNISETNDEDGLAALNALEASAERAQQTLASRPFLLAGWVKLRLYQQIGLNWLVSLQSRRLNGILADGKTVGTYCDIPCKCSNSML